jgi:hypothetical protein
MGEDDILKLPWSKENTTVGKRAKHYRTFFRKYTEIQSKLFTNRMELDRLTEIIKAKNPLLPGILDSTTITPTM